MTAEWIAAQFRRVAKIIDEVNTVELSRLKARRPSEPAR